MTDSETILAAIERRLEELAAEAANLQAARAALVAREQGEPVSQPRQTRRPTRAAPKPPRATPRPARATPKTTRATPRPPAAEPTPAAAAPAVAEPTPVAAETTPAAAEPTPPAARAEAKRARTAPRRAPRPRKPAEPLSTAAVEELLRQAGPLSAAELTRRTGAAHADVRGALDSLAAAGVARESGRGRAAAWRLLTDEERIAARTAELEAQLAAAATAQAQGTVRARPARARAARRS